MFENEFDLFASKPPIVIDRAHEADLSAILNLLKKSELPIDDIESHLKTAVVAKNQNEIVGCAALEMYKPYALLRSVAVARSYRTKGIGRVLTQAALELARTADVTQVYLLTETAPEFFSKFGFRSIERSKVPDLVRSSVEFTTACPESAIAMELNMQVTDWRIPSSESGGNV